MTQDELDRLLLVASLAVRVECRPERRDGSTPTTYDSSGATLARRMRAEPGSVEPAGQGEAPGTEAFHYWNVRIHAGAARRTLYTAWLRESPAEVDRLLHEQREREAFRRSLPHHERKRPPWGRL